jgi:hypothetical protein
MILLALIYGFALAWLVSEIINAPEGFEDEAGFHYGPQPLDDAAYRRADRDIREGA